ncbi:hypothetical protein P153DRAFT_367104 [Dothidotthia symphoricarpi CBS 119687]|uniref:Aminoglycoside phosphotransferase domain-containing protein n=1 Tax=Dothidotthia symphoricarpi CBS 119687 TaxID=1392245 RepID=A0A6A6AAA6_9PLEO|nr:uncharacterized protein P153DRAFT_367104 [Dothidotthia symphoricarpi CBS 119687]KAF2128750.1 hypothetical protein P153DRAFT_367104 [Dothidotthia symphoricarpi CBS 119687]
MPTSSSPTEVATALLAEKGWQLQSLKVIQSLWAGYGQICRITATSLLSADTESQSFILKLITPPTHANQIKDEGHMRKILSYQVEQYFYSQLAPQLPSSVPVAECLASVNEHHADGTSTTAMLMSDLRLEYPVAGEKREALSPTQVNASLDWLASFHGFWWPRVGTMDRSALVQPPLEELTKDGQRDASKTVWTNGGYTYLATRRTEYNTLAKDYHSDWNLLLTEPVDFEKSSISEIVALFLAPRITGRSPFTAYETLIHGDVKSENLFTSTAGDKVAFYDFQYVGLGLGVCDLAKLFTCSVPLHMLVSEQVIPRELAMQDGEKRLLQRYWQKLREVGEQEYEWTVFVRHWETALVDWLRFQASWGFWGNTEWLEARVRNILKDEEWSVALIANVRMAGLLDS